MSSYYGGLNLDSVQKYKNSVISEANSTSQKMLSLLTFTGEWINVSDFSEVGIFISTDVSGRLYVQHSTDSIFVDDDQLFNIVTDQIPQNPYPAPFSSYTVVHTIKVVAKYIRIVYINGPVTQSVFRLQTKLFKVGGGVGAVAVNDQVDGSSDTSLVRVGNEYNLDVARGLNSSQKIVTVVAWSDSVNTAVGGSDIWNGSPSNYPGFLLIPQFIEVISSSPTDNAAGPGARSVTIYGLDLLYNEISETLDTNGTAPSVASVNQYIRVFKAVVSTSGTFHEGNRGTLTVRVAGAGASVAIINTISANNAYGSSFNGFYTVPNGKVGFLRTLSFQNGNPTNNDDVLRLEYFIQTASASTVVAPFGGKNVIHKHLNNGSRKMDYVFDNPIMIPEKYDIWGRARSYAAANNYVTMWMEIIIFG